MHLREWYWLDDGDIDGNGWHASEFGDWSLTIGGAGCRSVVESYRGPWWVHFSPSELGPVVEDGPFKTLRAAKAACVRLAKEKAGEMLKALKESK
jgi:hypothetical protein